MNKFQRGFTLIELMIVVAIVGVLAAIAMPTYQGYTIRTQITEGLVLTGPIKNAIAAYYNDTGTFPANNSAAAVEAAEDYASKYVFSIAVDGPVISIQYGNDTNAQISGQTVTLTAVNNAGSVGWICASNGVVSEIYLPSSCK